MTMLRPLRGAGSPSFEVVVDRLFVGLVTIERPAPAYERLARRPSDSGAVFLWHAYMQGEAWRTAEPNGQALFVGSYDRLAAAVEVVEFLHTLRGCRWCDQRPHKPDCPCPEAQYEQATQVEEAAAGCHYEELETVRCPICRAQLSVVAESTTGP